MESNMISRKADSVNLEMHKSNASMRFLFFVYKNSSSSSPAPSASSCCFARPASQPLPLQAKVFFIHFMLCCLNLFSASLFLFAFCRLSTWLPTGSRMLIFFFSSLRDLPLRLTRRFVYDETSMRSSSVKLLFFTVTIFTAFSSKLPSNILSNANQLSLTHTAFLFNLCRAARNPRRERYVHV